MRKFGVMALLATMVGGTAMADWPQFMGPTGDGIAPESEKIIKKFPEGGPKELWKMAMAEGSSVPAIKDGKVYALDRPGAGATEKFSVLELATGKELWSLESESQAPKKNYGVTRGTPAIDGNMAYTMGFTGDVLAIDLEGKKVVWKKNIGKDFGAKPGGWGFAMSPIMLGENVLVDTPGSTKSGLVALDKKSGAVVWSSPAFGAADTYTSPVVTTIGGVQQAICWHKGAVAGVDTKEGKILWKFDWRTDRPIPNPIVLPDGKIFLSIGYGGGCTMLKVTKGADGFKVDTVFQDDRNGSKVSNGIFYKGYLYINSSDADQGLQCFDPDGNLKWASKQKFGLGSMIIVDGTIVMVAGGSGTVYLIEASPTGYKELSSAKLLSPPDVWAPIAVSDGKMVVRDQKMMKCFDVSGK